MLLSGLCQLSTKPAKFGSDTINVLITAGADLRHVATDPGQDSGTAAETGAAYPRENGGAYVSDIAMSPVLGFHVSSLGCLLLNLVKCLRLEHGWEVDLSQLKFKDRDVLQDVFKGWFRDVPFDVEALREQNYYGAYGRCRGYYRARYDHRKNLMDYDYQTFIKEAKLQILFGHTGVAFETRLASYATPNRSYNEAMDRTKGTTVMARVRGFWGDIINSRGPYHAFCTRTDSEAQFLAARPTVAVAIMQKMVDEGVDQANYRHAVNYLQYALVACYASGGTLYRRRLTRHISKWSQSIARESSTTGKRCWRQLIEYRHTETDIAEYNLTARSDGIGTCIYNNRSHAQTAAYTLDPHTEIPRRGCPSGQDAQQKILSAFIATPGTATQSGVDEGSMGLQRPARGNVQEKRFRTYLE
ncbi:Dynein assembly factor 3, axonemal [Symbiodinium microadriaticum]|uniref:Dynein assembly factor 3, axonemal n=1 Tax=Symbiodinium microadriaticum TaxID=2951 RepID=A0A1Q9EG43_SYMMI|nr:Dynein assembly factor 3, axonemal [Symbiodinium microadriaticum]